MQDAQYVIISEVFPVIVGLTLVLLCQYIVVATETVDTERVVVKIVLAETLLTVIDFVSVNILLSFT